MAYEPPLYNMVPNRRGKSSGVTIALVVILVLCGGCAAIGGLVTLVAGRGVLEVLPTIQAGIAATLTATAGPAQAVANNRQVPPAQPANTTPRPTNTPAPTATLRPTPTATPVRPTSTPLPKPEGLSVNNLVTLSCRFPAGVRL